MVAIVTGGGLGLENSSAWVLGSAGQVGQAGMGQAGDNIFVNAATGNLVITNLDEILVSRGEDMALARTYNSLGLLDDDNGDNWRPGTARRLTGLTGTVNTSGSTITRVDWDGSTQLFEFNGTMYETTDGKGAYDTLEFTGGFWYWTDGDTQIREKYSGSNLAVAWQEDASGNKLTYAYNGSLLATITDQSGDVTELVYGDANHPTYITQITTTAQNLATPQSDTITRTRVFYEYDSSGRLSSVKVDLDLDGSLTDGVSGVYTTTYTYVGTSKRVETVSQSDGSEITFEYQTIDGVKRVVSITRELSDGVNQVTTLDYDTVNRKTTITSMGTVTEVTYFSDGSLKKVTEPAGAFETTGQVRQFGYTDSGDVEWRTLSSHPQIDYLYENGNCVEERTAQGVTVSRRFSDKNELLTETRYRIPNPDYETESGQNTIAEAEELTFRYAYDASSRLRFMVSADGRVTEYRYSSVGRMTAKLIYSRTLYAVGPLELDEELLLATLESWASALTTKSEINRTDYTYDYRGNVLTEIRYATTNTTGTGNTGSEKTHIVYVYDQFGRLFTRHLLDENGQPTTSAAARAMAPLMASISVCRPASRSCSIDAR